MTDKLIPLDEFREFLLKIKKLIDSTSELSISNIDWHQALINDTALTDISSIIEDELAKIPPQPEHQNRTGIHWYTEWSRPSRHTGNRGLTLIWRITKTYLTHN